MGIIIVMVERIKIREGEINHLALGWVGGVVDGGRGAMVRRGRRR